MKRFEWIFLLMLAALLASCEKESFDYQPAELGPDHIDTILFTPSHYMLNTDGTSTLYLKMLPSYLEQKEDWTLLHSIAISSFKPEDYGYYYMTENGKEVRMESDHLTFAPGTAPEKLTVYGRIFNLETDRYEVQLRPGWGEGVKEKTMKVVFHVFEYTGLKNTDFQLEPVHVNEKMKRLNNAFSRLVSTGAVSTDTRLRFEAATQDNHGRPMAVAGFNRIKFGYEQVDRYNFGQYINGQGFDWDSFLKEYNAVWNPEEFLNIWIIPIKGINTPSYQPALISEGHAPLPGLDMETVGNGYRPTATEQGIIIRYSNFTSEDFNTTIGTFLGLLPTTDRKIMPDGDSDYCSDTFLYPRQDERNELKHGLNHAILFTSDNIMDKNSQSISVTNQQAERIHYILEHCPARKMWK